MDLPEEVLEALAKDHGPEAGARVVVDPRPNGHTIAQLWFGPALAITVNEPPGGWPVLVMHHHADPSVETVYKYCGDGHDPNVLHPDALNHEDRLTRAEFEKVMDQKDHTPIDSTDKLLKLCRQLLGSDETKRLRGTHDRRAKRLDRRFRHERREQPEQREQPRDQGQPERK